VKGIRKQAGFLFRTFQETGMIILSVSDGRPDIFRKQIRPFIRLKEKNERKH